MHLGHWHARDIVTECEAKSEAISPLRAHSAAFATGLVFDHGAGILLMGDAALRFDAPVAG
jgi:hypothetical protein